MRGSEIILRSLWPASAARAIAAGRVPIVVLWGCIALIALQTVLGVLAGMAPAAEPYDNVVDLVRSVINTSVCPFFAWFTTLMLADGVSLLLLPREDCRSPNLWARLSIAILSTLICAGVQFPISIGRIALFLWFYIVDQPGDFVHPPNVRALPARGAHEQVISAILIAQAVLFVIHLVSTYRAAAALLGEVGERNCTKCGYELPGVPDEACPECGTRWRPTPSTFAFERADATESQAGGSVG